MTQQEVEAIFEPVVTVCSVLICLKLSAIPTALKQVVDFVLGQMKTIQGRNLCSDALRELRSIWISKGLHKRSCWASAGYPTTERVYCF